MPFLMKYSFLFDTPWFLKFERICRNSIRIVIRYSPLFTPAFDGDGIDFFRSRLPSDKNVVGEGISPALTLLAFRFCDFPQVPKQRFAFRKIIPFIVAN